MTQIPAETKRRISRAVRRSEMESKHGPRSGSLRGYRSAKFIARAKADIEHMEQGDAVRVSSDELAWDMPAGTDEIKVYNFIGKVWKDSLIQVEWLGIQGDAPRSAMITQAFSATRIRARSAEAIASGELGRIDGWVPLNGKYEPTGTVRAFLPTEFVTIPNNTIVWADLVWRPASQSSRWEISNADCNNGGE